METKSKENFQLKVRKPIGSPLDVDLVRYGEEEKENYDYRSFPSIYCVSDEKSKLLINSTLKGVVNGKVAIIVAYGAESWLDFEEGNKEKAYSFEIW